MAASDPKDRLLTAYPGGDLVERGLSDLSHGVRSEAALLVTIAADRLRDLGLLIELPPPSKMSPEHALYLAIQERNPREAHSEYNALIARIVSFANAYSP